MTGKFDQEEHRFGMAYRARIDDQPIYPELFDGCNSPEEIITQYSLTRAPEHDLIPAADVLPLVEALRFYCDHDGYEVSSGTLDEFTSVTNVGNVIADEGKTAQQALSEFTAKHKEIANG